jgi:hypothetical protein
MSVPTIFVPAPKDGGPDAVVVVEGAVVVGGTVVVDGATVGRVVGVVGNAVVVAVVVVAVVVVAVVVEGGIVVVAEGGNVEGLSVVGVVLSAGAVVLAGVVVSSDDDAATPAPMATSTRPAAMAIHPQTGSLAQRRLHHDGDGPTGAGGGSPPVEGGGRSLIPTHATTLWPPRRGPAPSAP